MEELYLIQHCEGGYLCRTPEGRWDRVMHKEKATRLTHKKAENVIKNSISGVMRKYWTIVADETDENLNTKDKNETFHFDWSSLAQTQQQLFGDMIRYKKELRENLSFVDREICDIQHYIENFSLDAAKGYKAYRMLRERLTHRRFIKEEIAKVCSFTHGDADSFASGEILNRITSINRCTYSPRILNELFEGNNP